MQITINSKDDQIQYTCLYDLLQKTDVFTGFYKEVSASDFESILLNGTTLLAYNGNVLAGFINFEIHDSESGSFGVHNIVCALTGIDQDSIYGSLFQAEYEALQKGKSRHITAKVDRIDKYTCRLLEHYGFIKYQLERSAFKNKTYIGVQFIKYIYAPVPSRITLLKGQFKVWFIDHLFLTAAGEDSRLLTAYQKFIDHGKNKALGKSMAKRQELIRNIRKRNHVKVLFVASSLSMWKYQYLYKLLNMDSRFQLFIVICPFNNFTLEHQKAEAKVLADFFTEQGMPYLEYDFSTGMQDLKAAVNPDIVFFSQPYLDLIPNNNFNDRLPAYFPYGYYLEDESQYYNGEFQETAWKLFYYNDLQKQHARKYANNQGANAVVTGYPLADYFLFRKPENPWKKRPAGTKRVIWAPHFSINSNTSFTNHSSFLFIADFMLDLADKYKDSIQFAFKPHPRLKTELYGIHSWGEERTDAYYEKWENLENGQLENGPFVDLFLTSDAMIHDSMSFAVDYLYTRHPVMFVSGDIEVFKSLLDDIGKGALENHYIAGTKKQIEDFLEDVVLAGNDPKSMERQHFLEKNLLPKNGKSAAENAKDEIVKSLFS